jgi:branched-subunit amino acid aminotransferase/4-amino-4-deoxychorismate lyase
MVERPLRRVEIDGRAATVQSLWAAVGGSYGHFTAMQVRDRSVRGMDLHLTRLAEGTQALFGARIDGELIVERIRHAVGDDVRDASVRVYILESGASGGGPSTTVTVREPASMPTVPQSLTSVRYQRPLAHIKYVGGFAQAYYGRLAAADGFDEVLLVDTDEVIAEGSVTNIGFVDGDTVVWPDAPALRGISMQVLQRELGAAAVPWRKETLRLSDVGSFGGAFVTNARGIAPVARIDEVDIPVDGRLVSTLVRLFEGAPWEPIGP